ncbi:MAG: SPOR domain-containing protein [Glaciecola sp.]
MSSALQNRLVGTIIVVALVVIVLPEFLDGEKSTNQQNFLDIPARGDLVEVQPIEAMDTSRIEQALERPVEVLNESPVDEPQDTASANSTELADQAMSENSQAIATPEAGADDTTESVANNATSLNQNIDQSQLDTPNNITAEQSLTAIDVKDSGWVVQLGSFRHEKNVKELLKTLNNAGYRAYSRPVMTSVGELTKVFVGPELDKTKLELALPHLQEITQLKGKITAFEVSAG